MSFESRGCCPPIKLCDIVGDTQIPFLRKFVEQCNVGEPVTIVAQDFELDGVTPYTVVGQADFCPNTVLNQFEGLVLHRMCDEDTGEVTGYFAVVRTEEATPGYETIYFDTSINPTPTPPVNSSACEMPQYDFEIKKFCYLVDINSGTYDQFLRKYRIDVSGNIQAEDFRLDGVTPFNVLNEADVSECPDITGLEVCYQVYDEIDPRRNVAIDWGVDGQTAAESYPIGATTVTIESENPQEGGGTLIRVPSDSLAPTQQKVSIKFSRPVTNVDLTIAMTNDLVTWRDRLHSFNIFPTGAIGDFDISNGVSVEPTDALATGQIQWHGRAFNEITFIYEVYEYASLSPSFDLEIIAFNETTGYIDVRKAKCIYDSNSIIKFVDMLTGLSLVLSEVTLVDCVDDAENIHVEIGCLSSPASVDLATVARCNLTRAVINGEDFSLNLGSDWSVQDFVEAINAQNPGLLDIDGTTIVVTPGRSLGSIELICDVPDFTEDFGFNGADGARISTPNTNYTFTPSGIIYDTFYAITSFQDTGLEVWNNNEGNIVADANGDTNGNAFIVAANVEPGEFYRQQINSLTIGGEYSVTFYVINTTSYLGSIEPNIRVDIEDLSNNVLVSAETGDIPRTDDGVWVPFVFDFVASETSVEFVLVNNAPGGGGNDLAIDTIQFNRVSRQYLSMFPRGVLHPVEIVKTINNLGEITSLRVYSPDASTEYTIPDPNGLVLSSGDCKTTDDNCPDCFDWHVQRCDRRDTIIELNLFQFNATTEEVYRMNGLTGAIIDSHTPATNVNWTDGTIYDTDNDFLYLYDTNNGEWHRYDANNIAAGNTNIGTFAGDPIVGVLTFGAYDPSSGLGYAGNQDQTRYRINMDTLTVQALPPVTGEDLSGGYAQISSLSISPEGIHYYTNYLSPSVGNRWYTGDPLTGALTLIGEEPGLQLNGSDYDTGGLTGWYGVDANAARLYRWTLPDASDIQDIGEAFNPGGTLSVGATRVNSDYVAFQKIFHKRNGVITSQIHDYNGDNYLIQGVEVECPPVEPALSTFRMRQIETTLESGDSNYFLPDDTVTYTIHIESGSADINTFTRLAGWSITQPSVAYGDTLRLYPSIGIANILGTVHVSYTILS